MSRKGLFWLVSIGALGILAVIKYAVPGSSLVFLLSLTAASFGLVLFASPLGPVSCELEEKLIDRTREKASQYIGQVVESHWGKIVFKPVFTSPSFAAKFIRFLGVVLSIFATAQVYSMVIAGSF